MDPGAKIDMALSAAPPSSIISSLLADWLELAAFASHRGQVSVAEINEALEIEEDFEPEKIHFEDNLREERMQVVLAAIEERQRVMEGAYPFRLSNGGYRISLNPDWTNAGGAAYLLCLLLSHTAGEGLLIEDSLPDLAPARDLFQVCATLCAAGVCGGPAISFGWPRPDKTRFHEKLVEVYKIYGDGQPYPKPPPGSPPQLKDGGIDVIAWSYEPDGRQGTRYLLGQAASGQDWEKKSVRQYIDPFHEFWFEYRPTSKPEAALFIPFCLPESGSEEGYFGQEEAYDGHLRYLISILGTIYYRYRIPWHTARAITLAEEGITPIERLDSVKDVIKWVEDARRLLVQEVP